MQADLAKLVLRFGLGGMMILHGIGKLNGVDFIVGKLASAALPSVLAYGVYVGEIIAPLMLVLGYFTRIGGWLIVVNMIFAIYLVHVDEILALTERGVWAIELQALFLIAALAVALLGSGRFAARPD